MANLRGLTELSRLVLNNNCVSDAGLAYLDGYAEFLLPRPRRYAGLEPPACASEGAYELSPTLDLRSTQVADAGLAHLKGLHNLNCLHLSSTQLTDHGLAHQKGLTGLGYLNFRGTKVSDAGLVHLEGLTNLSELNVDGTQVTKEGVRSLQR